LTVYPSPDEDPLGPAPPPPRRRGRALVAAVLVLTVAGGAGAWMLLGGSGGLRGDGTVPLITADVQPYKFRPEDPGGYTVPHQDRMVFDRLHPDRAPQRTVERLLPPPEAPLSRPPPPPPAPVAPPLPVAPPPVAEAPPAAPSAPANPSAQRPAPGPLPEGSPQLPALPRPGVTVDGGATPPPAPPQTAAVAPPSPPSFSALGARRSRLQLGSLGSEDAARSEWQRLSRRFPDALGDLSPTYQSARVGERTVVRLIAGPVDDIRALAICDELKSANAPCIIVRP
jgi:hypothetical protein